ncbi:MAG: MFS transporter, partial [Lachnospiraceae bacterium]|nr:MFS transporter [Lachnospiraceae bacterium]
MTGNTKPMRTECTEKDIWLFSTGNIANCLIFNMVGLYIMYYYTN